MRPCGRPAWRISVRIACSFVLVAGVLFTLDASAWTASFRSGLPSSSPLIAWRAEVRAEATPFARGSSARTLSPTPRLARAVTTASATVTLTQAPVTPIVTHYSLAAAWPMVGHDAGQSYADPLGSIVPGAIPLLHLRWQAQGLTPQIEAQGVLYALDASGHAASFDAAMGTPRYQYQTSGVVGLAYASPYLYINRLSEIRIVTAETAGWAGSATDSAGTMAPSFSSLIVSGGRIYTGSGATSSTTIAQYYAFDAVTGSKVWEHPGSFTSVPCLAYGTLYLSFGAFGSADTYVIDAANGYQFRVLKKLGAIAWSAAGDRVYAGLLTGRSDNLRASVRAYDRFGKLTWTARDTLFGAALPEIMFGLRPGFVDARSAKDGHMLWTTPLPGLNSISSGSLAVSGNLVIVQADDGRIALLDRDTGVVLRELKPPFPSASARNLIVGGGIIFESIKSVQHGGKLGPPVLLAFGP